MTATSLQQHPIHQAPGGRRGQRDHENLTGGANHTTGAAPPADQMNTAMNTYAMPGAAPQAMSWDLAAPPVTTSAPMPPSGNPVVLPGSQPVGPPVVYAAAPMPPTANTSSSARSNNKSTTTRKAKSSSNNKESSEDKPAPDRRQKRLERNRESARLSRRRRKQYLEVLEDRVTQLSEEMDKGRREHVAECVPVLSEKRRQALECGDLLALEQNLSRTSMELRVTATFRAQQLQSLSLPPQTKFLLWLSLQTDNYYRGGRAASERLSAARIGERMRCSGTDKASPAQGMWPLFCSDVGLSYDQEERIRQFQKALLQKPETWLHRHTADASGRMLQSSHDCIQALHHMIGQRERQVMGVLSEEQRFRFLQWADQNRDRIASWTQSKQAQRPPVQEEYSVSSKNHDAANLYIMNHQLQKVLQNMPEAPRLIPSPSLKRFARRPSFESLGSSLSERGQKEEGGRGLSREVSFPSTGSLKRSLSELSAMGDEDRPITLSIAPEEAEAAAQPAVDAALGFIKAILPPPPSPKPDTATSTFKLPPPVPRAAPSGPPVAAPLPSQYAPPPSQPYDAFMQQQQVHPGAPPPVQALPTAVYSNHDVDLLPPGLNAVPEETLLQSHSLDPDGADDFLFELTEEDWAIGEGLDTGLDMDTTG